MLTILLALLILPGCLAHPSKPADQGLCESERTRYGTLRIICH